MSNPWGIKLKKTGLNEQRLATEQKDVASIESRQTEMARNLATDTEKNAIYSDRQASLAADATYGQQERFETGGKRSKSSKRRTRRIRRKTRRLRKQYRSRKNRQHH